eukprot:416732-Pyramimonas_sp.AAC.1
MRWTGHAFGPSMAFAGALLASVCPQSARFSQVGQLTFPGATNGGLAGPVFGKRLAVLRGVPG